MSGYRRGSKWNHLNELRCLLIFKQLEAKSFPRNLQTDLCREMAKNSGLGLNTIKAKVGNYKSVAGVIGQSNASQNTISIYNNYGQLSIGKIEELIASENAQ